MRAFKAVWMFLAAFMLVVGPTHAQEKSPGPPTAVGLDPATQVAFIGSGQIGGGTLAFRGRSYDITVGGLGAGGIGASRMTATGGVCKPPAPAAIVPLSNMAAKPTMHEIEAGPLNRGMPMPPRLISTSSLIATDAAARDRAGGRSWPPAPGVTHTATLDRSDRTAGSRRRA